jgi:hypothetical protein
MGRLRRSRKSLASDEGRRFSISMTGPPRWSTNGESVSERPWPAHFTVFDQNAPRANFFYLHDMFLVMDEEAEKVCRVAFSSGELLRFPAEGPGHVYLFNPLRRLDEHAVDWAATKASTVRTTT